MYLLVPFPKNQDFMELEGYEENSQPAMEDNQQGGASFIKVSWLMEKDESTTISLIKESFHDMPFSKRDLHIIESENEQAVPFEGGMTTREALIQIYYNQQ